MGEYNMSKKCDKSLKVIHILLVICSIILAGCSSPPKEVKDLVSQDLNESYNEEIVFIEKGRFPENFRSSHYPNGVDQVWCVKYKYQNQSNKLWYSFGYLVIRYKGYYDLLTYGNELHWEQVGCPGDFVELP